MGIDCSLTNLKAESVKRAKTSVQEGKSLIQQRQKMLKLADSSELGWKVVTEYQTNPLASDSDDERKIYKAEVGAERKNRKDQLKRLRTRKTSLRGTGRQLLSGTAMQPQSQAVGNPRPVTATATATSSGTRPENCWYCGTGGH